MAYGECELAADDSLVQEMHDAATGKGSHNENQSTENTKDSDDNSDERAQDLVHILNVKTFSEALTSDIRLYDIYNEVRNSTIIDDIFISEKSIQQKEEEMFNATNESELLKAHKEAEETRQRFAVSTQLERKNTLPAIDITTETYRSKGLIVVLWATILVT